MTAVSVLVFLMHSHKSIQKYHLDIEIVILYMSVLNNICYLGNVRGIQYVHMEAFLHYLCPNC